MTPEQWWELYGNETGADTEWASSTLAVLDASWDPGFGEIVSPYTTLMAGGWDVGANVVLELLTVDWDDSSQVGSMLCSLIGSVVGEAIGSLAGGIPIIGAVGGIIFDLISMGAKAEAAEREERLRQMQANAKACAEHARTNYDVRGTGPGGAALPCDQFFQGEIAPDMTIRPTGRKPSIGQTWDAMLTAWPKSTIEGRATYEWNLGPGSYWRSRYGENPEAFYRAILGWYGSAERDQWYGSAERWRIRSQSDWAPVIWRPEWPSFGGLDGPLGILRGAIEDQSAAKRPRVYVDGGRMLWPLWLDLWRNLTKVPSPGSTERPPMPFETLRAVYATLPSGSMLETSRAFPWAGGSMEPVPTPTPTDPFVPCGHDIRASLNAIEGMIDDWTLRVFPAYGPDKDAYLAQLQEGWAALDDYIREKMRGPMAQISVEASRARRPQRLVADSLREQLAGEGVISADAAAESKELDDFTERKPVSKAIGIGAIGLAGALGAFALTR